MLSDILKGNFLAGYKTYIVLWGGIAVTWLGVLTGVDLTCVWGGAAEASCTAPDVATAVNITWAAVAGVFIRKGVGA